MGTGLSVGHIQYTRNVVTGVSTAELAIVLIHSRNGVLTQRKGRPGGQILPGDEGVIIRV